MRKREKEEPEREGEREGERKEGREGKGREAEKKWIRTIYFSGQDD